MKPRHLIAGMALIHATLGVAWGQLVLLDQFDPGLGTLVSVGFDATQDHVWVYDDFAATLNSHTTVGTPVGSIPRPGEAANDVDIDFATSDFMLGATLVPAGTLLFINGETGTADVYAVDKTDGTVLATLVTAFGNNHVVGGAWHPLRGTLFLVADQFDSTPSTIAEIDPTTGAVLNSFGPGADFTVNFGDLDVSIITGDVFVASSDESVIRELTPTGAFVQDLALPGGVSSLSGVAIDDARVEAYLSGTSGTVFRVGAAPTSTTSTSTSVTTTTTSVTTTVTSVTSTITTTTTSSTTTTAPPASCELLDGKKLLLKSQTGKAKRGLGMLSLDADVTLGGGNGSADDPVLQGGTLRVVTSAGDGFDDTYELPADRWRYQKKEGENKGYKLRPTKPFKSVVVQPGKRIKMVANGTGLGHTLVANPDPVDVVLTLGAHCYCFRFGGDVTFKEDKKFLAKTAPAPSGCPPPGSPAGAFVE